MRRIETVLESDRMRLALKLASMVVLVCSVHGLGAQDLTPRAYVITPLHWNAVTVAWSFYDGSINFNGALPVSDAQRASVDDGRSMLGIVSYRHWQGPRLRQCSDLMSRLTVRREEKPCP